MESEQLPDSIQRIRRSLERYIKQRHEVTRFRRVLAAHLSSHSQTQMVSEVLRRSMFNVFKRTLGLGKNSQKPATITNKNPEANNQRSRGSAEDGSKVNDEFEILSQAFLGVVKYRRKHQCLRMVQDYVDVLAQKPAAAVDHLDPKVVLRDSEASPEVSPDVMGTARTRPDSEITDLEGLVNHLEKAVLRSKLLLQMEQKLLTKVKIVNSSIIVSSTPCWSRLQALGTTRNELINWIETELAEAGDNPIDSHDPKNAQFFGRGENTFIDNQLGSIQRLYDQYTTARRALILAATGKLNPQSPTTIVDDEKNAKLEKEVPPNPTIANQFIYPYLQGLLTVLNEQKSMIQQKSHLTISLAKHLKEAVSGLGRMADESHLLPVYPMPPGAQPRKGLEGPSSFGDELLSYEKPESSRRVRAWVFAADATKVDTNAAVSEKVDDGMMDVLEARRTLLELDRLLGEDSKAESMSSNTADIWAVLDGNLGVIKRDELD